MKKTILWVMMAFAFVTHSPRALSAVPRYLPLGKEAFLEWVVTNFPPWAIVTIQKTNSPGSLSTCPIRMTNGFDSYEQCRFNASSTALRAWNMMGRPSSGVRFRFVTSGGLTIDTPLYGTNITRETFQAMSPTLQPIRLSFGDATNVAVQFGEGETNSLPLGTNGILWNIPQDSGRIRLTLTSPDGSVATYTQDGEAIQPPVFSIYPAPQNPYHNLYYQTPEPLSHNILLRFTLGTDTTIEKTTNFLTWDVIGTVLWDYRNNYIEMRILTDTPGQFFRAVSR